MPQVIITQEAGQIRIDAQIPPEPALLLLAQAIEILRTQVIAKAVQDLPPKVTIETSLPGTTNGVAPGAHGLRGGDVQFKRGPSGG